MFNRLFCSHKKAGWPRLKKGWQGPEVPHEVLSKNQCYQRCYECGAIRDFDFDTWTAKGPWYNEPIGQAASGAKQGIKPLES